MNGVLAFERSAEGEARIVVVINAGLNYWQEKNYGVWVYGGVFEQVITTGHARLMLCNRRIFLARCSLCDARILCVWHVSRWRGIFL